MSVTSIADLAATLDLAAAGPYLRTHGWELVSQGALGDRWQLRLDHETRNVALPHAVLDDHDRRLMLATVLRTLADVEERHPIAIAADFTDATSDLLEFRVRAERLTEGEIPLRAAPELTTGAFEALQAAARAEVARRAHYAQGTLPTPVRSFVEGATLAGTERGSVILRVRAPVPPVPPQLTIDGVPAPATFERRAVGRLVEAMRAAKTATHRDPARIDMDALDEDIEDGLSANLCLALLKLSGSQNDLDGRVSLRVRWALTQPTDEPATEVELERGELGRLDAIAAILKEVEPQPNTTVVGPVTRFERAQGEDVGRVTIDAEVDDRVRPVRIWLERSDYEKAMSAHTRDLEIQATGTLERAGRGRDLTDASSIEVIGEP